MLTSEYQYRKLGGWLMFILVMNIIIIAINLFSTPGNFASALSYPDLSVVFGLIRGLALLALNVVTVLMLLKRKLRPFRICFLASRGLMVLNITIAALGQSTAGPGLENVIYNGLYSIPGYMDSLSSMGLDSGDLFNITADVIRVMVVIFWAIALIMLGILIAWAFYFKRSRRVAVYFGRGAEFTPPPPPDYGFPQNAGHSAPQSPGPMPPQGPDTIPSQGQGYASPPSYGQGAYFSGYGSYQNYGPAGPSPMMPPPPGYPAYPEAPVHPETPAHGQAPAEAPAGTPPAAPANPDVPAAPDVPAPPNPPDAPAPPANS